MIRTDRPEIFGFSPQEQVTAPLLIDRISGYIETCPDVLPSRNTSLALLAKIKNTGLFDRMETIEREQRYFPLSHSVMVAYFAANVSRQLNTLCIESLGSYIVDEPLLVASAMFHDLGKVVNDQDIEKMGLKGIDLTPYTTCFPPTASSNQIESNDILKSIALMLSFGKDYIPFATTVAHSIYHLVYEKDIPLERLLLMLADFSVVNLDSPDVKIWPKAGFVSSLVERVDLVIGRYHGTNEEYLRFYFILEAIKSNLERAGIRFPPYTDKPDFEFDPEKIHLAGFIKLLNILNVQRISIPQA